MKGDLPVDPAVSRQGVIDYTGSAPLVVSERVSATAERIVRLAHLPAPGALEACTGDCDHHDTLCGVMIAVPGPWMPAGHDVPLCEDCSAAASPLASTAAAGPHILPLPLNPEQYKAKDLVDHHGPVWNLRQRPAWPAPARPIWNLRQRPAWPAPARPI